MTTNWNLIMWPSLLTLLSSICCSYEWLVQTLLRSLWELAERLTRLGLHVCQSLLAGILSPRARLKNRVHGIGLIGLGCSRSGNLLRPRFGGKLV